MYCDRCGTEIQEGQKFCGSCGKPAGMAIVQPSSGQGRVARHLTILGVLWFAAAALNLLAGLWMLLISNVVFRLVRVPELPRLAGIAGGMVAVIGFLCLAKGLASAAAAWGLLERQGWARPLTLVLGFLSLILIPFGTALGIYTIWVLLSGDAEAEYGRLARAA